jgi:hypothetical protein
VRPLRGADIPGVDPSKSTVIRLALVSLPAGATGRDLDLAVPLGTRAAVAARIRDLLPGVTFDDNQDGAFRRAGYTLTFHLAGDEPVRVDVEIDDVGGFVALKRITDKTGWQAVDTGAGCFIDLDASRAAGMTVPRGAAVRDAPSAMAPSPWPRRARHGAVIALLAAGFVISVRWSHRATGLPRSEAAPALLAIASAVSSARASATPGGEAAQSAQGLLQRMAAGAQGMRQQLMYLKLLGPDFRGDPIARQMLDYAVASSLFPSSLGENGFLPPERLADPQLFAALHMPPPLPATFAAARRDGYEFQFAGVCDRPARVIAQLGPLCGAFVYSAHPVGAVRPGARSYALLTADDRIHYRTDGGVPAASDPTVDNTAPSSADDLNRLGSPTLAPNTHSRIVTALQRATSAMARAAGFASAREATAAFHEQNAIMDLREVLAVEQVFVAMVSRGYASPERLSDAGATATVNARPLLPAYFMQPLRLGYRFQFAGEQPMPIDERTAPFGAFYQSFVYSAIPVDPGPPGRRSFAAYANGAIYATPERRVPTRADQPLSAR